MVSGPLYSPQVTWIQLSLLCDRAKSSGGLRAFSPFYGFSRIYPQHTNLQDGGTSLDGISRAGVNKVVGRLYQEGMRKPSRNGNPGDLIMADAHKLARHFLKLRWRNPDQAADL
eukprot:2097518-Rhodomonas_salina.1